MTIERQDDWSLTTGTVARRVAGGLAPFVLSVSTGPVVTPHLDAGAVAGACMYDTGFLVGSYRITCGEHSAGTASPHPDYAQAAADIARWIEEDADLGDEDWPSIDEILENSRTRCRE